jgi:hypothetical protein
VIRRSPPPDEPAAAPPSPADPPSPAPAAPPAGQAPQAADQAADSVTPPPLLDLRDMEAAKQVQQRLVELGFLAGAVDGVWGARSRRALQDFKVVHGIGDDDSWDEATQEQLLATPDAHAGAAQVAFIGGWGADAAECRSAPLTITARGAEAGSGACDFHSTQREGSNIWRLHARCSDGSERWTANIQLTLSGRKLTWSSERGTAIYVRCPR